MGVQAYRTAKTFGGNVPSNGMENTGTRITKVLSEQGICSRREAEEWIVMGRVLVDGKVPAPGVRVTRRQLIRVDGRKLEWRTEEAVYLAYNKPLGIVCTTDPRESDNIVDAVNHPERVFPIGRLDKDSEGLILMTSDGDIVNKILRAGNQHEKEYDVTVNRTIIDDVLNRMAGGLPILGTVTKKCRVERISPVRFRIVLVQGLNRQIRRMCEHLGYRVKRLKRTRIMGIHLDVPQGQWRSLTPEELATIRALTAASSKTAPPKSSRSAPADEKSVTNKAPHKAAKAGRKSGQIPTGNKRGKAPASGKRVGKSAIRPVGNSGKFSAPGQAKPAGKRASPGTRQAPKAGKKNEKGHRGGSR